MASSRTTPSTHAPGPALDAVSAHRPHHAQPRLARRSVLGAAGVLAALSVAALTACQERPASSAGSAPASAAGTSASSTAPAPPSPTATPAPSLKAADETTSPQTSWGSGTQEAEAAGEAGYEVALRTGVHEDYDRVVVQLSGQGTVGYRAELIDPADAATAGKGDRVTVAGRYVIRVIGRGTTMPINPGDAEQAYSGPAQLAAGGAVVHEVYLDSTVEDQFQLFIGTDSDQFRVSTLTDPSRLVVDVRH